MVGTDRAEFRCVAISTCLVFSPFLRYMLLSYRKNWNERKTCYVVQNSLLWKRGARHCNKKKCSAALKDIKAGKYPTLPEVASPTTYHIFFVYFSYYSIRLKEKSVPDLSLHTGSAVQNIMAIGGVLVSLGRSETLEFVAGQIRQEIDVFSLFELK